jgi:glycosyltransferase involved in cell wall biosynthesis
MFMEGRARISVAMPVRDAGVWVGEALASVLRQTETSFEVLAVDDGSSDGSRGILEEFARRDSRVRILETSPAARGIVAALNLALAAARAPYLARMDADDRMHPERLARQAAALDADPTLFGVTSRSAAFPAEELRDGMRAYLDWQNGLLTPADLARDRFIESPLLHPSVMFCVQPLRDNLSGWRDLGRPEDWDLFLRVFEADLRIARLPELLLEWRLHARQSTRTHPRYSEESLLALRAHFLARHLAPVVAGGRPIWILGAGPVGKALVKALAVEGVVAEGLADVDPRKIGGVVRGAGRHWPVVAHETLRPITPRPFAVSAVAGAVARGRVRTELGRWGWSEGADFVVAA